MPPNYNEIRDLVAAAPCGERKGRAIGPGHPPAATLRKGLRQANSVTSDLPGGKGGTMEAAVNAAKGQVRSDDRTRLAPASPFQFTGKAGEYFKIWIVNILLTILTLGIYSAWAKVRRKRYFYGNTLLQESAFEYLAEPMQILKGRLIAFAIFVVYLVVTSMVPPVAPVLGLAFMAVLPWLVVKAHAFNARYSAYRNIRFDFRANYGEAVGVYIGLALLAGITLGLAYPYYAYRRSRFVMAHSGYGITPFTFSAPAKAFYMIYLKAVLIAILGGVVASVIVGMLQAGLAAGEPGKVPAYVMTLFPVFVIVVFLWVWVYIKTASANLVWSNTALERHRLRSTLKTSKMLWLYITNALAIALSLGLMIPWAQIRTTRYRLENMAVLTAGDLDGFVASQREGVASAGEEIADFFDFDVGI